MPHSAAFTRPALSASAGFASALLGGVLALSLLSLALSRLEGGIALVWLSNGFAVGLLVWLRHAPPAWLWLALGAALVVPRLLADEPLLRAALVSAFNLAEIALVVYGVRRYGRPLSEPAALLGNAGLAAAFSSAASLFTAVATSLGLGLIDQRPLGAWSTATAIFSAHLLGLVITAGLVAFAIGHRGRLFGRRGRRASFALTWSALLGVLLLVLAQSTYPLLFLPFLPLAWMSFRHGVSGAVVGVLSIGVASGVASILQLGPFQLVDETHAFAHRLLPQVYVLAACMLALPLGLMMAERRRLLRSLRSSESQYRLLAEHTRDLVVRLGADGSNRYVSASSLGLLGYEPEDLLQSRWDLVHPDDSDALQQRLDELFTHGGAARIEFRVHHRDGHWVWIEALAQRVPTERGEGWDIVYSGRDVSERVAAEQALQAQARTDALTGLANRREFEERLDRALARARRRRSPLAVLALDLDHFKQINDSLGHAAGDEALCEFGRRVREIVYEVDLVARLGGDEFVVLMQNLGDPEGSDIAAARLIERMAEPMQLAGVERVVQTSIGIAYCAEGESSAEALVAAADAALYESKRGGRGRYLRVDIPAAS